MKFKIFYGPGFEHLEKTVNEWLAKNDRITIKFIAQSQSQAPFEKDKLADAWIAITIWYD